MNLGREIKPELGTVRSWGWGTGCVVWEGRIPYTRIFGDPQYKTRNLLSGVRGWWDGGRNFSSFQSIVFPTL